MRKTNDKDVVVNLLRTIEEQNRTIDKLTDKVIALSKPEAVPVYDKSEESPKTPPKEDQTEDLYDADPDLVTDAINDGKP